MTPTSFRAAVFESPMHTAVKHIPTEELAQGKMRVRLQGCGVCASNIPVWEGRPWFQYPLPAGAPGHEGWGTVDAVGPNVSKFAVGERVAFMSDRAYAECDVVPEDAAVRLPDALDDKPFPGEPLACVMNIFERSDIRAGQKVAIVGAGFLGLLLTQLASSAGAEVVVISRRGYALDLARQCGAREIVGSEIAMQAQQRAWELTDGQGYERVIEVVGLQSTLDMASALAAENGRLVIAGYHQDGKREVDMQQWNWRGLDVVNAHERKLSRYVQGMQRAIDAVMAGKLDPFRLITHQVPLQSLDTAFALACMRPPGFVKAVVKFEEQH